MIRDDVARVSGLLVSLFLSTATGETVTWSEHIAPIVFQLCAPCHHPGEAAPFPLLTYEDVRKRAAQIADLTKRRYMPPWPPEPGHGDFAGSRRLTQAQIALFAKWALSGAPAGDLSKAPVAPQFTAGWRLGPPDAILKMTTAYRLTAEPGDVFRNFVIPTAFTETRYVRALELHPGNARVVHHANVVMDRTRSMRARDGQDGEPGFPGMDVEAPAGEEFAPDSHFLFWKPGTPPEPLPPGMAWRLDPGTDLVVNLHLQPSGKPETILAEIGLYFEQQPPTRFPMLIQLEHDGGIDIPPGAMDFAVEDHFRLPVAAEVLAIYPHAHYIGKTVQAWATLPNGSREELLLIRNWNINWQAVYTYRKPVALPTGTLVSMLITYDNSSRNPRNPMHPPQRVRAGNRSRDEMGHVWLQVLPESDGKADPRLIVQDALMRRRLEKYPGDFLAMFNLGSALQSLGQNDEGRKYLEQAVAVKPDDALARNALGAALMMSGDIEKGIAQFRGVLHDQPANANARFNLARALAAQGDAAGAIREFETLLQHEPEDAKAHYLLAGILVEEKRYADAEPHFRIAAERSPRDAEIQTNYGTVLAVQGKYAEAIAAFERALKIDPAHQVARSNLERALASLKKGR
jgi:Tfp pilus assembly protein PilF